MTTTATAPKSTATKTRRATAKKPVRKTTSAPQKGQKAKPEATQPKRVPAPDTVAQEISRRLLEARSSGIARPVLAQESGLTQSHIWRCETGRALESEVQALTAMFARIDSGDIKPKARAVRASHQAARAVAALETLGELVKKAREAKAAERTRILDEALAVLDAAQTPADLSIDLSAAK